MVAQTQQELVTSAPYIKEQIIDHGILHDALRHAVKERQVQLSIVSTSESLNRFSSVGWVAENRNRVRFFRPRPNVESVRNLGSHAKFCISDGMTAYVGSANLTYLGIHEHIEMGVLLNGEIVRQISEFWIKLVEKGFYIEEELLGR